MYDITGRVVDVLFEGQVDAEVVYTIEFANDQIMPGVYVAQLLGDDGLIMTTTLIRTE